MNNYIFSIFFVLLSFSGIFTNVEATSQSNFNQVPQQIRSVVVKMLDLPEARELLSQVSQEGSVGIVMQNDPNGQFDALWDGDARLIKLNPYRHQNEGSWICSILFELHNAKTNKYMLGLFRSAEQNQVTKEIWVEQMERMEHANALNACRLLEKGIAKGIYPPEARWTIFNVFDDYYKLQQLAGHSQWLANYYDQSNRYSQRLPFKGTIPGLSQMTAEDKKDLQEYLVIKNNLDGASKRDSFKNLTWLKEEYVRLEECNSGKRRQGCFRAQEKLKLMRLVFNLETAI